MGATTAGLGLGRLGALGPGRKGQIEPSPHFSCINTNRAGAGAGPGLSPYPTPNPSDFAQVLHISNPIPLFRGGFWVSVFGDLL